MSGRAALLTLLFLLVPLSAAFADPAHPWIEDNETRDTLEKRLAPPSGFVRVPAAEGSFAHWLRQLPMKPAGARVRLYNGAYKFNQLAHTEVIDIDVGKRDLQQCADAIMRLRAEYLYGQKRFEEIAFNFTDGKRVAFSARSRGRDYKSFRKYMTLIFAYAGTYSLEREMKKVAIAEMRIGDVFIKGGFPGHAVLIADMVEKPETGEKRFLLVQSFMPAQDMHVLRNPANPFSSWYPQDFGGTLITPEWIFSSDNLKRFPADK